MKEIPCCDFHIHTKYLGCANATMAVPAIVRECERLGMTSVGIADHLNRLEQVELHRSIKSDIEALETDIDVYFGVELNYQGLDGSFAYSREIQEEHGFQFAIGGIHGTYLQTYDLGKLVEIQHRHHLKTCRDPLASVLVHPYWFGKGEFDRQGWPWFDSMQAVPESFARELGQVARETGTAIEINACANLCSPNYDDRYVEEYIAYLAIVADEGPRFALGSDAHDISRLSSAQTARQVAERLQLPADRVWMPGCRPLVGDKASPRG